MENWQVAPDTAFDAFVALGKYLEDDGWFPQRMGDDLIYRVGFAGQNAQVTCFAQIRPEIEVFLFHIVLPVKVPEKARMAVAEFITRANYGLLIGNFEMDFTDGEVRYKSSLDFEGSTLDHPLMRGVIYTAVQTMDRYIMGIMSVIYGGVSPKEAVDEVEKELHSSG